MLVIKYAWNYYTKIIGESDFRSKDVLERTCDDLMKWGERRGFELADAACEMISVNRVFETSHGPREIETEKNVWMLQRENRHFLSDLDKRIIEDYKTLKVAGVKKPSIVLFCHYLLHVHLSKNDERFEGRPEAWRGVIFVLQRLESTCRAALRYEHFDLFGPVITRHSNGDVSLDYTVNKWKRILVGRGCLPVKKKRGRDGSRRGSDTRRSMRQMQNTVEDKKTGKRKGGGGRLGGERGNRSVSRNSRRSGVSELQEDLQFVSKSSVKRDEENGSG